jgi:hypothetical protein
VRAAYPGRHAAEVCTALCEDLGSRAAIDDPLGALRGALEVAQATLEDVAGARRGKGDGGKAPRYPVLTDTEVETYKPALGLVGNILYSDSVAYLFAVKDAWKTFVAVSWACCIAAGVEWLGRPVEQGLVVYVPAEGGRGIGRRIRAWKRHHGIDRSIDVLVVPMPVNLLDRDAIPDLMAALEAHPRLQGRKPALIVFDTLARSMDGGDENETKTANAVTAAAGLLKARYGCCVLIVHHCGWSAQTRMRGNSALGANADIIVRIAAPDVEEGERRAPGSVVTLHSVHAKETDNFEDVKLTTALEEWTDDDGVKDGSLVIVSPNQTQMAAHEAQTQEDRRQVKGSQLVALRALVAAGHGLAAADWHRASKLGKSTFFAAIRMLRKLGAVECDPADAKYRVTDAGVEWAK